MAGWTVKVNFIEKLEAFEMWLCRRMLKISWTAKMTNIEVPSSILREGELLTIIKKKKNAYLERVMKKKLTVVDR